MNNPFNFLLSTISTIRPLIDNHQFDNDICTDKLCNSIYGQEEEQLNNDVKNNNNNSKVVILTFGDTHNSIY